MPYVRTLSAFRDEVRRKGMAKVPHSEFLELTDRLRDEELVPLGVALDDQEGMPSIAHISLEVLMLCADGKALVKLVPPSVLIKGRDEKRAALAAKAAQKEASRLAAQKQALAKLEKSKVSPEELFKPPNVPEGMYGSWDERGIPLTDGQGQEIGKGKAKKLVREWEDQGKKHEAWKKHVAEQEAKKGSSSAT